MIEYLIPVAGPIIFIAGCCLSKYLYQKEQKKFKAKLKPINHWHIIYQEPDKKDLYMMYYGCDGILTTEHDKAKIFYNLKDAQFTFDMINPIHKSNMFLIEETHPCREN